MIFLLFSYLGGQLKIENLCMEIYNLCSCHRNMRVHCDLKPENSTSSRYLHSIYFLSITFHLLPFIYRKAFIYILLQIMLLLVYEIHLQITHMPMSCINFCKIDCNSLLLNRGS
ncbi:hypothetical protein GIB67_020799 [Kingdonia uniflora]|uniref:Uncharacterized protein n=1 Tax=Kingdonia uniflora TaxID=39325 RepID=A0A7J7M777_9MAGN|nr:hypothetical protein GIB67_020799 [Kingdonia uniflora]